MTTAAGVHDCEAVDGGRAEARAEQARCARYIMSDLVGVPDLFRYIGPILKRTFLRRRDHLDLDPEGPRGARVPLVGCGGPAPTLKRTKGEQ